MIELTTEEVGMVSGGLRSLAVGIAANIIYDGLGGWDGISSMMESANDYLTDMAMDAGSEILADPVGHGYID